MKAVGRQGLEPSHLLIGVRLAQQKGGNKVAALMSRLCRNGNTRSNTPFGRIKTTYSAPLANRAGKW